MTIQQAINLEQKNIALYNRLTRIEIELKDEMEQGYEEEIDDDEDFQIRTDIDAAWREWNTKFNELGEFITLIGGKEKFEKAKNKYHSDKFGL